MKDELCIEHEKAEQNQKLQQEEGKPENALKEITDEQVKSILKSVFRQSDIIEMLESIKLQAKQQS